MRFFGKGKCELTGIVRIFGFGKCKLIANFSATMITSLPSISLSLSVSLSLSLSLSLSPSVPHAQYRKRFRASYKTHNIGSASTLPIIYVLYFFFVHYPLGIRKPAAVHAGAIAPGTRSCQTRTPSTFFYFWCEKGGGGFVRTLRTPLAMCLG